MNFVFPLRPLATAGLTFLAFAIALAAPVNAGTIVRFDTTLGDFDVELYDNVVPQTVANFLDYVLDGDYTNTLVHRTVPNFVVQGGGFTSNGSAIPTDPAIPLQYVLPNERGTLAMARTAAPNTATSQWFINTVDNTAGLGPGGFSTDGYAVFGRVLGSGMDVVDAIAAVPRYQFAAPFGELPLQNYTMGNPIVDANKILINSVTVVPEPSAIVLGAMGLAGLGVVWRKRRQKFSGWKSCRSIR
jgi:cyclophilin family peptidyl-prolyl cis-trans isomerase